MSRRRAIHYKVGTEEHGWGVVDLASCGSFRGDILDDGKTPMTTTPSLVTCGNCRRTEAFRKTYFHEKIAEKARKLGVPMHDDIARHITGKPVLAPWCARHNFKHEVEFDFLAMGPAISGTLIFVGTGVD
jgi:hypothetical protein